jgi:ubiquitin-protein ligase
VRRLRSSNTSASGAHPQGAAEPIRLSPVRGNLHEWHFTIAGVEGTDYEGGLYHGRVRVPADYPHSPPSVRFYTRSGRFVPNVDICTSATAHHPEMWQPAWDVRTLVTALRTHMLTDPAEIGGMHATGAERRALAKASRTFACGKCGCSHAALLAQGFMIGGGSAVADGGDCESESERDAADAAAAAEDGAAAEDVTLAQVVSTAVTAATKTAETEVVVAAPPMNTSLVRALADILTSPPVLFSLLIMVFLLLNKDVDVRVSFVLPAW